MSPPHAGAQAAPQSALLNSLADEDEDDICPVCESECTCRNRDNPPSVGRSSVPIRTFTSSSTSSSQPHAPPSQTTQPLKIRLTVPPNLKFRKNLAAGTLASTSRHVPLHSAPSHATGRTNSSTVSATIPHQMAMTLDSAAPKRRGRPSKVVLAAREAAKAALAAAHGSTSNSRDATRMASRKGASTLSAGVVARGPSHATKGRKAIPALKKSKGKRPMVAGSLSSDEDPQYPTFMSAASTSSLTSSSESSSIESSEDSESSDDDMDILLYARHDQDKSRHKKELPNGDALQKRRDQGSSSRREIKPRRQSVDPVDEQDADSEDTGDEDGDDEDDSDDDSDSEEEDVAVEADVEEDNLAELEEPEMEETDGKLGVSFGGLPSGWSEDDEEESFDADVFFANLEDSSDSCGSPAALRLDPFSSDVLSDGDFSADEEDALLLMDIDPSVQVRRTPGEFAVGVELDGISLGLDGQLLFPAHYGPFPFDDGTETDVEMTVSQGGSSTDDQMTSRSDAEDGAVVLVESDGETTEDELVDANGLPNEKAMMLFRWPAPVSTVDPLSTVSPLDNELHDSPGASQTLRMALASMSATPTPSDILAGRISMEDIEEIEMGADRHADSMRAGGSDSRRTPGFPTMGRFTTCPSGVSSPGRHAVIDGNGAAIPSPYPRSRAARSKRRSPTRASTVRIRLDFPTFGGLIYLPNQESDARLPKVSVQVPSSDERGQQHSQAQTSDDPSSTEAIDLDDVLDAAFLDSEPSLDEPGTPSQSNNWLSPSTPSHSENLNRWDRIPVATFRRTRETPMLESTPGSDNGLANLYSALLSNEMLGTPKSKSTKPKGSSSKRYGRNGAASNALVISPVLLPVLDGDRTPTGGGQSLYNPFLQHDNSHQQKSRRELRKDKAMLKRKMLAKNPHPSPRHHQQHSHRQHLPNMKTRGTNSVQRTHSTSHIPHLNL